MKRRLVVGVSMLISLFVLAILSVAAQEDACFAKNGNWQSDTQKCVMSAGVHVDVDYPLEFADYPSAVAVIDSFVLDSQKNFIASYTPDYSLPSYANDWSMQISYENYQFSDFVRSVAFDMSFYTGGAHPNSGYKTFNFDVNQDKELKLADLFVNGDIPWDMLSQLVQDDLKTQLADMSDATTIEQGTGTNPNNYQSWVLSDDGLIFLFDPYQVAAYAAGPQKVVIPFTALSTVLNPQFSS